MAALDDQLVVSPSEVNREDIWPLESTEAGEVQGDTEDSQANNLGDGGRTKVSGLRSAQDNSNSRKAFHDNSSA